MLLTLNQKEEENRKKALFISIIAHSILIVLALLPLLSYPVPPPGQAGILVSFGEPDRGSGEDNPDTQSEIPEQQTTEEVQEEIDEETEEDVSEPTEAETPAESAAESSPSKEVVTAEDLEAARLAKERREREEQIQAEKEEQKRRMEEAEQRKKEEEQRKLAEAKRKAEAKKKYDEAKKQYGDLFGDGKGETNDAGNQGDPDGDPNSKILEGVSTGTGTVGAGLENRGVMKRPSIKDNSQDRGTVVVKVCVNQSGNVISASYTQKGSLSISDNLRQKSVEAAKQFKFTPSDIDRQCGLITFDYKLQ